MRSVLAIVCVLVGALVCVGAPCAAQNGDPGSSFLLATYAPGGRTVWASAYNLTFTPNDFHAEASILRDSVRTAYVPYPTKDIGSLRRDSTMYVPGLEMLMTMHVIGGEVDANSASSSKEKIVLEEDLFVGNAKARRTPPAQPRATLSQLYGYNFATNATTFIQPVPEYAFSCTVYNPRIDIVYGLSSVQQVDGQWNVSLVSVEYNGDIYSWHIPFWSTLMLAPMASSQEDPCRPQCAYDHDQNLFSFHWPQTDAATPGTLTTLNISFVNYVSSATLVSTVQFPPVLNSTSAPGQVRGLAYTSGIPGVLTFLGSYPQSIGTELVESIGTINPVTGASTGSQTSTDAWVSPRLVATATADMYGNVAPLVLVVEYAKPWRVLVWTGPMTNTLTYTQIEFDGQVSDQTTILGVHPWQTYLVL